MSSSFVMDAGELSATRADADAGLVDAQFRLALHYQASGAWSYADEVKWMKAAADQGHQLAQFYYAHGLIHGDGERSALVAASSLSILNQLKSASITTDKFTASSTQLDAKNMEVLHADIATCLHHMGYARASFYQHLLVANRLAKSSTIRGESLMAASQLLLHGDGDLPIDERYALQLLEDATKLLPSEAFLRLGDLLLTGRDVYDVTRAAACYRSEMKRDNNEVELLRLVRMHAIGMGVNVDKEGALALIKPLCDEDKAPAGELGMWAAYVGYTSPGKRWKPYERVHELACNETNGDAQYCWAMAHLHGTLDRRKDIRVAIDWFTKASVNGHVHARAQLALLQPYSRVIRREGLLTKKGAIVPSWKLRFFVLDQSCISYAEFKETDPKKEQKIIRSLPLAGMRIGIAAAVDCSKPFAFTLRHVLDTRNFLCVANSVQERDEWMAAITSARDIATWSRVYPHEGSGPLAPFGVTSATELVERTITHALSPSATGGAITVAAATPAAVPIIEVKRDGGMILDDTASSTGGDGRHAPPTTPMTPIDGIPITMPPPGLSSHTRTSTPTTIPIAAGTPASDAS